MARFNNYQNLWEDASEPQDWGFIQDVVAPAPAPAPAPSPSPFNPVGFDWTQGVQNIGGTIYQPQFNMVSAGHGEEGQRSEPGELQNVLRYKEGATGPGQSYEIIDPTTGKVTGTGQFKEQSKGFFGDLWGGVSQAAADLAPILQYTPIGPAVMAINAANAARSGDVLPALGTLAGIGGYTDIANAARAATAIKNEDYLGALLPALNAAGISDVGGFGAKDIGNAINVVRAIESENPLALLSSASKFLPKLQSQPTESASLFPEFDQPLLTAEPPSSAMTPTELNRFLEANVEDPATVEALMRGYYPEIYTPAPMDNETAKFMRQQELAQAGESPLGGMGPGAKELPLINLSNTPTSTVAPSVPNKPPTASAKKQDDFGLLMRLAAEMTPQQQRQPDPYQGARINTKTPFGMDLVT